MLIRVFPSHWEIREAGSLEEKGKGLSLLPFFVRQVPILDSALANRGGSVGYIFIVEKNNYLRLRGFVGSSFLGFFNFLVAMLGVPPYFFGLPGLGRRLDYRHITRRPCQQILVFSVSRNTAYGQEMVQDSKSVGTKKGGKAKLPPFCSDYISHPRSRGSVTQFAATCLRPLRLATQPSTAWWLQASWIS
jgi:hypothetical protein